MIVGKIDAKLMTGKKISDIITDKTKILTEFVDGYEIKDKVFINDDMYSGSYENMDVLVDSNSGIVICLKDGQAVCLFGVYEVQDVSLNGKRGLVTAMGHETVHEYWFDDGEYRSDHTR